MLVVLGCDGGGHKTNKNLVAGAINSILKNYKDNIS